MRQRSCVTILSVLSVLIVAGAEANGPIQRHPSPVAGQFMVLLDRQIAAAAYDGIVNSLAETYNMTIVNRWRTQPLGFVCAGVADADVERLNRDPRVRVVEEDFNVVMSATQWAVWNGQYLSSVDRLDEPSYWLSDSTYDMCPEARTILAYVIDNGIRGDHEQFTLGEPASRVVYSRAFDDYSVNGYVDTANGCTTPPAPYQPNFNGWHGTAVASLLGGTTVGAAKTQLVSLRVFDCAGHGVASWMVNAVRWIRSTNDPYRNAVALVNMSAAVTTWGPITDFTNLNDAVQALVTGTQIPFFTSADNYSGDACQFAPAALAYTNVNPNGTVFSVGATSTGGGGDKNDYRWQTWNGNQPRLGPDSGSNGGRCVSMYAPGTAVYSARTTAATAYASDMSGTSFASPLTAGVAARYMERFGLTTYQQVYARLLAAASSTGTQVYNVATPESWFCVSQTGSKNPAWLAFSTNPGTCPSEYVGVNRTATPVHFPATNNESSAGMIYSDMTCP